MEKLISLRANSYDDKEKIVSALTNSGYIVGTELEKDKIIPSRAYGWRIDIYKKTTDEISIHTNGFS